MPTYIGEVGDKVWRKVCQIAVLFVVLKQSRFSKRRCILEGLGTDICYFLLLFAVVLLVSLSLFRFLPSRSRSLFQFVAYNNLR